MTYQVNASQLPDRAQFEKDVNDHIAKLHAFNYSKDPRAARPTAHPLVMACLKRIQKPGLPDQYVADYEIVEDNKMTLEEKKDLLVGKLHYLEGKAREKVFPRRKLRLFNTRINVVQGKPAPDHTDEDKAVLERYKEINAKLGAIHLAGAEAEAAIEDLTEENIDTWQPPTFD
jgi:hypothetical protein